MARSAVTADWARCFEPGRADDDEQLLAAVGAVARNASSNVFESDGEPAALKYGAHEHERPERGRGRRNHPQPTPTQAHEDDDGAGGHCDRDDEAAEMKSESFFVVAVQISYLPLAMLILRS